MEFLRVSFQGGTDVWEREERKVRGKTEAMQRRFCRGMRVDRERKNSGYRVRLTSLCGTDWGMGPVEGDNAVRNLTRLGFRP